eukprot:2902086-Pyramimonas_sp.AAC.1
MAQRVRERVYRRSTVGRQRAHSLVAPVLLLACDGELVEPGQHNVADILKARVALDHPGGA